MITDCMQFQNELFKIPFFDDDYFKTEGGHGGEQQAKSSNNTQLLAGLLCPQCSWAKDLVSVDKCMKYRWLGERCPLVVNNISLNRYFPDSLLRILFANSAIWIKGSYEPKKDFDADLYWYVFNATCVENFTLTQLCVRMALEVAL